MDGAPHPLFQRTGISRNPGEPLYRRIYEQLRTAILTGTLKPGERVPSWNSLAAQLGVARGTVQAAYERLTGEGYLVGRGPAGTIVNPELSTLSPNPVRGGFRTEAPPLVPPPEPEELQYPWGTAPLPFQMGVPALDAFPRTVWSRLMRVNASRLSAGSMVYQDPAGTPELREAVAAYLTVARGIVCKPSQVLITAGFTGAIELVTRALLCPGDGIWFEDPGYFRAREALRLAGAKLLPVPVDAEGISVAHGCSFAPLARFALVTPSHQSPLGMPLSLPRRLALLDWASSNQSWIIEDDYYGEFRYGARPVPALKSLDHAGRVIYAGTFSKVLLPSLRLGYVVVPEAIVGRCLRIASYLQPSPAALIQMTVADFIQQGHFGRHIQKMRALYATRRSAVVAALQAAFGNTIRLSLQESGMHLVAHLPPGADDVLLARHAASAGLGVAPVTPWAISANIEPALLLSFANIRPADAGALARRLWDVLSPHLSSSRRARLQLPAGVPVDTRCPAD